MSKIYLFLLLTAVLSLFVLLSNYLLLSDTLYFNTFSEQLTYEQIEGIIAKSKEWAWIGYVLIPLFTISKLALVASCLSIGLYFFTDRFSFKAAFGVALEAEFIFLVPALLKILWFVFVQTDYSLQDLQSFYPLSALNIFDYTQVQPWLIYPLQLFNVFEIIYWVVIVKRIESIAPSAGFSALASYSAGLLLWVAVVMFISVSYSP